MTKRKTVKAEEVVDEINKLTCCFYKCGKFDGKKILLEAEDGHAICDSCLLNCIAILVDEARVVSNGA